MSDFFDEVPSWRDEGASSPAPHNDNGHEVEPRPRRFALLVAADASPASGHVIRSAAALARIIPGAEIHIVHVLTDVEAGKPLELDRVPPDASLARGLDRGLAQIAELAVQAHEACTAHVVPHVCAGDPAREILQLAAKIEADLIVVGARSGHGLRKLVLGSVAEKVVRRSRCPVFVTRPKAAEAAETHRRGAPAFR